MKNILLPLSYELEDTIVQNFMFRDYKTVKTRITKKSIRPDDFKDDMLVLNSFECIFEYYYGEGWGKIYTNYIKGINQ